jgi:REP element-mobilizing transposase RayT
MILAWHIVWTAYGWWFPNDVRGAWSRDVRSPALRELGEVDKRGRRAAQPTAAELEKWIVAAQKRLKYPVVVLDESARKVAHDSVVTYAQTHGYHIHSLAIMREHIHIVVARHSDSYERMARALKTISARALRRHWGWVRQGEMKARRQAPRLNRSVGRPVWSRGRWVRYLDNEIAIASVVAYVEHQREGG